ncbi:acyl carrier protein 1, chloroplastic [Trifolium repens]|nr:acyl carrier protein 1, chloroplastic [Trifolium repens]
MGAAFRIESRWLMCCRDGREALWISSSWLDTYASIQRKHLKAKSEIVHKVCDIVKKQLAVPDDSNAIGECKFTNTCEVSYRQYFRGF